MNINECVFFFYIKFEKKYTIFFENKTIRPISKCFLNFQPKKYSNFFRKLYKTRK